MPSRAHRYLIPLAALIPILPLLLAGPSCGHDFDFHILNWLEAARQLSHFHYPQWAYTPAFNAGEPRFVFYPPISWLSGALLGSVLPWHYAPIAFTWLALIASGFTLYRFAARYASASAATLAAVFYLANPYMLFTAYERTAYGELLAAAWIPMLLAAILARRVTLVSIAIPVALLWLTNAPAAVMSCYVLALLTAVRLAGLFYFRLRLQRAINQPQAGATHVLSAPQHTPLGLAAIASAGLLLGLALAAIYLVPAIHERPFIQSAMAVLPGMRIADNTLFHHTSDEAHDGVLHTASMLSLVLLAATVSLFAAVGGTRLRAARVPLAVLTVTIAFLLTPLSLPLWNHLPEAGFLQFPWRLLAILAAVLAFELAITLRKVTLKALPLTAVSLAIAAALTYPAFDHFQQLCDDPDTVEARVTLFHSSLGTEPTDEYTPTTADNDALQHGDPPYWLAQTPDAQAPANALPGQAPARLTVDAPAPEILILNLRQYPQWSVTLNGSTVQTDPTGTRDDGLLTIPIPAGHDMVTLTLQRKWDQTAGLLLSIFALLILLFLLGTPFHLRRKRPA